jgi:hypothetical protein
MNDDKPGAQAESNPRPRHLVRLPGFLPEDQEVGLGDVVKRATSLAGIKPCSGCAQRAAAMSRWLTFTSRNSGQR